VEPWLPTDDLFTTRCDMMKKTLHYDEVKCMTLLIQFGCHVYIYIHIYIYENNVNMVISNGALIAYWRPITGLIGVQLSLGTLPRGKGEL
jgi:hypothetical protein